MTKSRTIYKSDAIDRGEVAYYVRCFGEHGKGVRVVFVVRAKKVNNVSEQEEASKNCMIAVIVTMLINKGIFCS